MNAAVLGHPLTRFESQSLTVVLLACAFPYLSFGPIATTSQVQPWAALLAWAWVLVRAVNGGVRVSGGHLLLIGFGLWFMVYVYEGAGFDVTVYLRRSAAFLLCAGIVLAVQYASPMQVWRVLRIAAPVWTAFGALRYVSPSNYFALVRPLVPTVVESGMRGSSSLAPEATDFGFTMVALLGVGLIARHALDRQGVSVPRWPLVLLVLSCVLSKSGTGVFGLAIVLVVWMMTKSRSRKVVRYAVVGLLAVGAAYVVANLPATGIRGLDLLSAAIREPLSLLDGTASYRIVHNAVGFWGMVDSGFRGYGAGAFTLEGLHVYERHALGDYFRLTGWYAQNVPLTLTESPVAFFAVILLEYGLVGIVYLGVVFGQVIRGSSQLRWLAATMMFLTWIQSFPAAWPLFWVVLALATSPLYADRLRVPAPARSAQPRRHEGRVVA